jgi:hypothetical protein
VLYLAAAMTGLRQGELLGLRWRDVDFEAQRVRVVAPYVRGEFGDPKSEDSGRSVPLASRVVEALGALRERSLYAADDDLVFGHPETGHPLDRSKLVRRFRAALKRAGVRRVTFHELRHTFGTRMAAAGVPLRTIQHWMGHADAKTTQVYAHYQPSDAEAETIDNAFPSSETLPVSSSMGAGAPAELRATCPSPPWVYDELRPPEDGALRAPACTTTPSPMHQRVGPVALRRRCAPRRFASEKAGVDLVVRACRERRSSPRSGLPHKRPNRAQRDSLPCPS